MLISEPRQGGPGLTLSFIWTYQCSFATSSSSKGLCAPYRRCAGYAYLGGRKLGGQEPLKGISIHQPAQDGQLLLLGCLLPVFHPLHKPLLLLAAQKKELNSSSVDKSRYTVLKRMQGKMSSCSTREMSMQAFVLMLMLMSQSIACVMPVLVGLTQSTQHQNREYLKHNDEERVEINTSQGHRDWLVNGIKADRVVLSGQMIQFSCECATVGCLHPLDDCWQGPCSVRCTGV